MRTWRVGTLTMGAVLLLTGMGLLYAQVNEKQVLGWIAHWWPLIFIFLGAEVLWQSYQAKKAAAKVSYDILGVFIIIVLICFGLGMEALRETGVIEQCKTALALQDYTLQQALDPIPIDAGIKKVVIEQSSNPLELVSYSGNQITGSIKAEVRAETRIEADNLLKQGGNIQTRREGDTLYLAFNSSGRENRMFAGLVYQNNTVYLPAQLQVSIYSGVNEIKIHASDIVNDWYINGVQSAAVDLPKTSNLTIIAETNNSADLQGNAPWTLKEPPPAANTNEENEGLIRTEGTLVTGNGQHKILINSNGLVSVDLLP